MLDHRAAAAAAAAATAVKLQLDEVNAARRPAEAGQPQPCVLRMVGGPPAPGWEAEGGVALSLVNWPVLALPSWPPPPPAGSKFGEQTDGPHGSASWLNATSLP